MKIKELESGDSEPDSDLLTALLSAKNDNTGEKIPLHLVRDESLTFLFAGHGIFIIS